MISTRCELRQTETSNLFTSQEILSKATALRPEMTQDDVIFTLESFGYTGTIAALDLQSLPEEAYNTALLAHLISAKGLEQDIMQKGSPLRKLLLRVNGAEIAQVNDEYVSALVDLETDPEQLDFLYNRVNKLNLVQQMMFATNNRFTYFPPSVPTQD